MRLIRPTLASLACVALLAGAVAAAPPNPLRLIPDDADLIVEVKRPRQLVEAVTTLELVKQLQGFDAVRDFFESTDYRQFYQLVAYFEKELGGKWPELLDRLGGGGAALAVRYGAEPTSAVLVLQGADEAAVQKFAKLAVDVAEQELARQEAKDRPEKGSYRQIETLRVGKEFHAAVAGAALLISNSEKALQESLDLHLDKDKKSMAGAEGLAQARKQLPNDPLALGWLNMERIRQLPGAKEVFNSDAQDPNAVLFFGGLFGVAKRTPYVAAGLYRDQDGFLLTVRTPVGTEVMGPESVLFIPPAGQPGSRPLLEPKGVLLSTSYFLDAAKLWTEREKLFNKEQVQAFEEFDKTAGRFLLGNSLGKLLTQAGAYQRVVVVNQAKSGAYQTVPKYSIPAFAVVAELGEPEAFGRSVEAIVRGAALLAGTQVRIKLMEEKQGDTNIVGYRFDEKAPLQGDTNNLRFNFSPCIARVGNQMIFCSTLELCHELVDLVEKEAKDLAAKSIPAVSLTRVYSQGGAELIKVFEDTLIAQTILDQGVGAAKAKKQIQDLIELVRRLGVLQFEEAYGAKDLRYDLRLQLKK